MDPIGSLYYEFFKTGKVGKAQTYVVEGIGEDIFPSTMDFKVLDDVLQVTDQECFVCARKLVKSEGIFTGGSGGGCVSAALRVARELPAGSFVVAFLPDTGMRYLSKVYSDEWMRERGYAGIGSAADGRGRGGGQASRRQGARADHRAALSNRVSRAAHHAGAGHFAIAGLRGEHRGGHDLRGPDPEPGAARARTCASW